MVLPSCRFREMFYARSAREREVYGECLRACAAPMPRFHGPLFSRH